MMRGKDGAGAHVAAGKPDLVEQERHLGAGRREAQVGRHGDDGAGARADALDRRDDRLRRGAHGLHQFARHAREGGEALGVHLDEGADDLEHVAAGREVAACPRDDDGFDLIVLGAGMEEIGQLAVALEGERVLLVRTVEGHGRDGAIDRRAGSDAAHSRTAAG